MGGGAGLGGLCPPAAGGWGWKHPRPPREWRQSWVGSPRLVAAGASGQAQPSSPWAINPCSGCRWDDGEAELPAPTLGHRYPPGPAPLDTPKASSCMDRSSQSCPKSMGQSMSQTQPGFSLPSGTARSPVHQPWAILPCLPPSHPKYQLEVPPRNQTEVLGPLLVSQSLRTWQNTAGRAHSHPRVVGHF